MTEHSLLWLEQHAGERHLKNVQCDVNQSAGVDIVDVQLVAGAFNQTVPPAPVAYDLQRDNLIDVRDVTLAVQCWAARR